MTRNYTVMGTIIDGKTITLDEPIPLSAGRVKMVVEELAFEQVSSLEDFLEKLQRRREGRNYVPRSREEIDRALQEDRDGWDDIR
jgi:hypothetical protein